MRWTLLAYGGISISRTGNCVSVSDLRQLAAFCLLLPHSQISKKVPMAMAATIHNVLNEKALASIITTAAVYDTKYL